MRWFNRTAAPTLRCRDTARHAHRLAVAPHVDQSGPRVTLALDGAPLLLLSPLQAGRLRAQLRDALLAADAQCRATQPSTAPAGSRA